MSSGGNLNPDPPRGGLPNLEKGAVETGSVEGSVLVLSPKSCNARGAVWLERLTR